MSYQIKSVMPGSLFKKILAIMRSGFFFDARKVSPSIPEEENERVQNSPRKRLLNNCQKQKSASRLLNVFRSASTSSSSSENQSNCGNKTEDCEHDLADLVHDFIENGCGNSDSLSSQKHSDNWITDIAKLNETLQSLVSVRSVAERDAWMIISTTVMNSGGSDLFCLNTGVNCDGNCIPKLILKALKNAGFDAATCKTTWNNSVIVPGGDYEYIDIVQDGINNETEHVIIDMDFQSQFKLARPVTQYETMVKQLPVVFLGRASKLEQILEIMCKAAEYSLQENSMPVPPWRTFDYMKAKWFSPCERNTDLVNHEALSTTKNKNCGEHLVQLKSFMKKETKYVGTRNKIFSRAKPCCR